MGHHLPLPAYGPGAAASLGPPPAAPPFEIKSTSTISLTGAVHSRPQPLRQLEQKGICLLVWAGGGRVSAGRVLPPRSLHLNQAMSRG